MGSERGTHICIEIEREKWRLLEREGERCTHIHIEIERDGNTKLGRASE